MYTNPKKIFLGLCILATILAGSCNNKGTPGVTASPLTALLSELRGLVQIKQPDQSDYTMAMDGMVLQVGGDVRTGEDGRARLDLSSGSIVRLAPLTTFHLESNTLATGNLFTRLKVEAGRIWVILRGGSMEVETPSGLASVRGSLLSVWIDPDTQDVWVSCFEGWCRAENPSGVLDLLGGQGAILYSFDPQGTVPPPPPMLRFLTPEEIEEFLRNNPEARDLLEGIIATASAQPTLTGTPTPTATPTNTATSTPIYTPTFTLTRPPMTGGVASKTPTYTSTPRQARTATYTITLTPTDSPTLFEYVAGPIGALEQCVNLYAANVTDADGIAAVWVHFKVMEGNYLPYIEKELARIGTYNILQEGDVPLYTENGTYWSAYFSIRTQYGGTVVSPYPNIVEWYFSALDNRDVVGTSYPPYTFVDNLRCSEGASFP